MDALIVRLATGLGLANAIGWFAPIYFGVVNVLPLLLSLFYYADKSSEFNAVVEERKSGARNLPEINYDFIIVGAGSAGCIVASRLSKYFNVLLLERGGEPNPLIQVPALQQALLGHNEVDYRYTTAPQNHSCFACVNRETYWNAGIGLGGGSIINGMIYIRGHPFDYDRWAKVVKDDRWKYENLLPYFLRSEGLCTDCENSEGVIPSVDSNYHNNYGELPIRPPPISPLVPEFLGAMEWAGVKKGDMNAPYYTEIADTHTYNHIRGRRITTYEAFVEPNLGKSLKVIKYARVMQIIFEPGTNKAIGVKYERFGKIEVVKASKEVIVSAGANESPKLLMLSGIGPAEDLRRHKIPVRCNLPVGRNLQNHATSFVGPFLIDKPLSILPERDLNETVVDAFLQNGTGPFSIMFAHAHTMLTSSKAHRSGESEWPDIQIHMQAAGIGQQFEDRMSEHYNLKLDLLRQFFEPIRGKDAFILNVNYARPKSRGTIRLRSNNYLDHPIIDPQFYSDRGNVDAEVTVEGIQRAVHIAENAPSYRQLGTRLSPVPFHSCKHLPHRSKEYWLCFIKHVTLAMHHFAGTTSMGTVVDAELKVKGTTGLRIIDAGIMPFVVSTNSYAASMVIAERGSDFVIETYFHK